MEKKVIAEKASKYTDEVRQQIVKLGYIGPVYGGIYGSQNYGLDTEKSDIDMKCIVLPSYTHICNDKMWFVKEYVTSDGSLIIASDVRHFFDQLKKCSPPTVETLFSNVLVTESICSWCSVMLDRMKEDIARMYPAQAVRALKGMMVSNYNKYISVVNVKAACQVLRLAELIDKYIKTDRPYAEILKCERYKSVILETKSKGQICSELVETTFRDSLKTADEFITKGDYLVHRTSELLDDLCWEMLQIGAQSRMREEE